MGMTFTFGSGVADSVFGKCQAPIKMFLESQGEAYEQSSQIGRLFTKEKDRSFGVTMTGMTAMQGFEPVGELGEYPKSDMREGFQKFIAHDTWKNSFSVSREAVEDGKLMDLKKNPRAFLKSYQRTREEFGARIYAGAMGGKETVSVNGRKFDITCADGKPLFHKSHPSILDGKKVQCNVFSDAFSASALSKLETKMQHFEGDAGNLLNVSPTTILIPNDAAAKEKVFSIIGADKDPATSNNAFNYQFGRWNVLCWSYLDRYLTKGTDFPWALLDEEYSQDSWGAVWFDRTELDVRSVLAHNDANEWLGYSRWSAGFNDWRFAAMGGMSGAEAL